MKPVPGKELCRVLKSAGWTLLRVHGSHHIFGKPGTKVRLSVPVHGNQPLKMGLLKHLLKMADLPEDVISQ